MPRRTQRRPAMLHPKPRPSPTIRFEIAILLAAAASLVFQLFIPPIVGIADNGDYEKVLGYVGLKHLAQTYEDKYFNWVNSKYVFAPFGWWRSAYLTSETPVAFVARMLGWAMATDRTFDIRILATAHCSLMLAAFAGILRATRQLTPWPRMVIGVLSVVVFTDAGYAVYLNSFYSQTASLLFLLLTVAFAGVSLASSPDAKWPRRGFLLASILFITSKPQESVQAFPLVLALIALDYRSTSFTWRRTAPAAVGLAAIGVAMFVSTPEYLQRTAPYNMVFAEMLPKSSTPQADLEWFGVDPNLQRFSGTNFYTKEGPANESWFIEAFSSHVSSFGIATFYVTHPARFWEVLHRRASQAFSIQAPHAGTYEKASGFPARTVTDTLNVWSEVKEFLLPASFWTVLALFLGNLALAAARIRTSPSHPVWQCLAVLAIMAFGAFLICTLGDCLENERHLFTFNALTDLCLIADVAILAEWCGRRAARVPPS